MLREEKEIKLDLVSEDNYKTLLLHCNKSAKTRIQKNYFFDTPDKNLLKQKWVLRIRLFDNQALMTAKGPGTGEKEGLLVRPEIECDIAKEEATQAITSGIGIDKLPQEIVEVIGKHIVNNQLHVFLDFETNRTCVEMEIPGKKISLDIDRTTFSDSATDYEMEIELGSTVDYDMALAGIKELFERLKIPRVFQKQDKFVRALKKTGYNTPINS